MKTMIFASLVAFVMAMGTANAARYTPPAQNYYQNSWVNG